MHMSDENFSTESVLSTETDSDEDFCPAYKRQNLNEWMKKLQLSLVMENGF